MGLGSVSRFARFFDLDEIDPSQYGFIEELSTCFYLGTALLKSSESELYETWIFNIKMIFAFWHWENIVSSSIYPSWGHPVKLWKLTSQLYSWSYWVPGARSCRRLVSLRQPLTNSCLVSFPSLFTSILLKISSALLSGVSSLSA